MPKLLLALLAGGLLAGTAQAKLLHEERSLYRNILVEEDNGRRCMKFSLRLKNPQNQSCFELAHPERLVFDYARMSLAGLLVQPKPGRILILGLGGGTLPLTLRRLYPDSRIDNVEIDEAVVRTARQYFGYAEDVQMRTHVRDARLFVRAARRRETRYDLILLDAFNGDYIPEHLMTREFLKEVKDLLAPGGIVVANTFSTSRLYHHESATYAAVFGPFLNVIGPDRRNRIIVASTAPLPDEPLLRQRAQAFASRFQALGVDVEALLPRIHRDADWPADVRVLTDQYNPANLLKAE